MGKNKWWISGWKSGPKGNKKDKTKNYVFVILFLIIISKLHSCECVQIWMTTNKQQILAFQRIYQKKINQTFTLIVRVFCCEITSLIFIHAMEKINYVIHTFETGHFSILGLPILWSDWFPQRLRENFFKKAASASNHNNQNNSKVLKFYSKFIFRQISTVTFGQSRGSHKKQVPKLLRVSRSIFLQFHHYLF